MRSAASIATADIAPTSTSGGNLRSRPIYTDQPHNNARDQCKCSEGIHRGSSGISIHRRWVCDCSTLSAMVWALRPS